MPCQRNMRYCYVVLSYWCISGISGNLGILNFPKLQKSINVIFAGDNYVCMAKQSPRNIMLSQLTGLKAFDLCSSPEIAGIDLFMTKNTLVYLCQFTKRTSYRVVDIWNWHDLRVSYF